MAMIHDLGESCVEENSPCDGIDPAAKHALERQAVAWIVAGMEGAADWLTPWDEYERDESNEARFVGQLDRLEMDFQASVYELQCDGDLSPFSD